MFDVDEFIEREKLYRLGAMRPRTWCKRCGAPTNPQPALPAEFEQGETHSYEELCGRCLNKIRKHFGTDK